MVALAFSSSSFQTLMEREAGGGGGGGRKKNLLLSVSLHTSDRKERGGEREQLGCVDLCETDSGEKWTSKIVVEEELVASSNGMRRWMTDSLKMETVVS